jgi:hypothetical protein
VAPPLLALMIRFVRITGWRGHEIRSLEHRQLEPGGILLQRAKGGKRELWEWTPSLILVRLQESNPGPTAYKASRKSQRTGSGLRTSGRIDRDRGRRTGTACGRPLRGEP